MSIIIFSVASVALAFFGLSFIAATTKSKRNLYITDLHKISPNERTMVEEMTDAEMFV